MFNKFIKRPVLSIVISIIITLLGVCCAYQINFATLMIDIPWISHRTTVTMLVIISALLVAPFTFAKDLSALSSISTIGLLCIILNIISIHNEIS